MDNTKGRRYLSNKKKTRLTNRKLNYTEPICLYLFISRFVGSKDFS